ncbi:MAG: HIRAN domain-containing protein [Clostridiales bacterium]|nr:HIRAN domain-containing protein [Clostridiales bacterium]MDY4181475.1 HIRAN domain-containing protein [Pseudoflavonifractor sp.]
MEERYVTITGFRHYYGMLPFAIGNVIRCQKEPRNQYDGEAIRCSLPTIGTVGYLANSTSTVAGGTMSAGRIYDQVGSRFHVRVLFTTSSKIICRVETGTLESLEREIWRQSEDGWQEDQQQNECEMSF